MLVVVTGISHKTAPLELRERLTLDEGAAVRLTQELLDTGSASEAVALSTCNRTELYLYARDAEAARQAAATCLTRTAECSPDELEPSLYSYSGDAAMAHLFRVTASLDSMVVGEAQIVAQLKAAYQNACDGGCTSLVFNRLFRHALEVGKRVRTETAIGERPVSISSAAVELAQQVFGKLDGHTVLIIGAGEMSELTATHLKAHGIEDILVANRTLSSAEELAARMGGRAVPFEDLQAHLEASDIVISSTSAPGYVVTRELAEAALKRRRKRPIFYIDIAVPRDLDPAINKLRNAYLYDIDDLQQVVKQSRHEREKEAQHAERIVAQELDNVNDWLRSLEVVPTIANLRRSVDEIRRAELERLGGKMSDLSDEQRAQVEMLTTSIVNKILHTPTVKMKEVAGSQDCYVYVDAVRTLFDLGDDAGESDANGAAGAGASAAPEPATAAPAEAADGAGGRSGDAAPEPPAPEPAATVHHLRGTGTENP